MKKIAILSCFSLFLSFGLAQPDQTIKSGQTTDHETIKMLEDTLGLLGYVIVNDSLEENRLIAVKNFYSYSGQSVKIRKLF